VISTLNEIFRKAIEQIKQLLRRLRPFIEFIEVVDPVDYWKLVTARVRIKAGVQAFMHTYNVPGLSLAIAYRGRLVFSEGYGLANTTTNETVTPQHLFRIASISKPITSVAVFNLIERNIVNLSRPVFGANGILGTTYGPLPSNSDIYKITVQHLLEHTSGWNNVNTDIMYVPDTEADHSLTLSTWQNMTQDDLIRWMIAHRSLAYAPPGAVHDYLNFGYLVLGRVIERVSGMSYADFVQQQVLAPCGISDMHIAGDTLADRRTNEVVYYSQDAFDPYAIRVSRMDAHGGWIASPTDLVRFLARVDRFPVPPDILLSSASMNTMLTPTTAIDTHGNPSTYAKGWKTHITSGNYFHDGNLAGTAGLLVRTKTAYCYAALANTCYGDELNPALNNERREQFIDRLDHLMDDIINAIGDKGWPYGETL
jgi:CubicO group peptidase (beta-lactamase class C family)